MIVEYDPASGRILHIVLDPVPEGERASLPGTLSLDLPPVRHHRPVMLNGEPLLDDDGEPVMECFRSDLADVDHHRDCVHEGAICRRPDCPAIVSVAGRTITLTDVPAGAELSLAIGGIVVPIDDTVIEVDEAGPLTLRIVSPWPYLEAVHDLEIQ